MLFFPTIVTFNILSFFNPDTYHDRSEHFGSVHEVDGLAGKSHACESLLNHCLCGALQGLLVHVSTSTMRQDDTVAVAVGAWFVNASLDLLVFVHYLHIRIEHFNFRVWDKISLDMKLVSFQY